ncbi:MULTISPECIES: zinc ribbon domain-containing protein [Halomonas]|uniref:Putative transposase-like DNA-binding protein n=1 Tax=Halomonas ventosae TaxID=229007 RepID=A0A4R6HNH4_9GAMM|nr:zinc ribbon domain-containing protein [Halomonas ventosae]TDO09775.1 putative transposase-like DNA-binding protein [Halomonas ventosae]
MKMNTSPECPNCGSRSKRLPPGREDQYHVYCDECGHDFGRFDHFQAQFRHVIEDLEAHLRQADATDDSRS